MSLNPGDLVDVTIRDAEVMAVDGERVIIQKPWTDEYRRTIIDVSHPSVTVTPHAADGCDHELCGGDGGRCPGCGHDPHAAGGGAELTEARARS